MIGARVQTKGQHGKDDLYRFVIDSNVLVKPSQTKLKSKLHLSASVVAQP